MRRPRHKLHVSTFPFLAVLLCAMGALILFLLVMDQRAKVVAKRKAQESVDAREAQRELNDAARKAEWEKQRDALHEALLEQQKALQGEAKQLEAKLAAAGKQLRAALSVEAAAKNAAVAKTLTLAELRAQLKAWQAGLQDSDKQATVVTAELKRLNAQVAELEAVLTELKGLKRQEHDTFSLVPYQGKRGDTRNPIYIECVSNGLILHPDRKPLQGLEFDALTLRSEVERRAGGLQREIKKKQREVEPGPPRGPYVLFLVRPDGIVSYYHALGYLRGFEIDFGYEVVDQHWVLDFTPGDHRAGAPPWDTTIRPGVKKITGVSRRPDFGSGPAPLLPAGTTSGLVGMPSGTSVSPVGGGPRIGGIGSYPFGGSKPLGSGVGGIGGPGAPGSGVPGTGGGGSGIGGSGGGPGVAGGGVPGFGPPGSGTGAALPGARQTGAGGLANGVPGRPGYGGPGFGNGQPGAGGQGVYPGGSGVSGRAPGMGVGVANPGVPGYAGLSVGSGTGSANAAGGVPGAIIPGSARGTGGAAGYPGYTGGSGTGGAGSGAVAGPPGTGGAVLGAPTGPSFGVPGGGTAAGYPSGGPGTVPLVQAGPGLPHGGAAPGAYGTGGTTGGGMSGGSATGGSAIGGSTTGGGAIGGGATGGGAIGGGATGGGATGGGATGGAGTGDNPTGGGASGASAAGSGANGSGGAQGSPGQGSPNAGAATSQPAGAPGAAPSWSIPGTTLAKGTPKSSGSAPPSAPDEPDGPGPKKSNLFAASTPGAGGSGGSGGWSPPLQSLPPLPSDLKQRPRPAPAPLGLRLGNRDFVITLVCYSDHVTVFPGGKQHWWKHGSAAAIEQRVLDNVQGLIVGRQRSVAPGDALYRPLVRFQLGPDGLDGYLRLYPRLAILQVPMTRENLEE